MMKEFQILKNIEKLYILQQIWYENFIIFLECFHHQEFSFATFEYIFISLSQISASPLYSTEIQLTAILRQVHHCSNIPCIYWQMQILNSFTYLALKNLIHNFLTCSNVLIRPNEVIKIDEQSFILQVLCWYQSSKLKALL